MGTRRWSPPFSPLFLLLRSHLYPAEEDLVPDAVAADDPGTDFSSFSLGCKVEQPPLEWSVGLAEDLQEAHSGLQSVWIYCHAQV